MKTIITLTLIILFQVSTFAQENYSRAKIWFNGKGLTTLANLGLAVDHGSVKQNTFIISDFSETEIQKAKNAGFKVDILIEDVKSHYVQQANQPVTKNAACPENTSTSYDPKIPSNFELGSMAGYYTYQEYIDILDDMHDKYPTLISERAPVSDTLTHEGRPLFFVKISNDPQTTQTKPRVLYTAIHHAREPGSLSETIFFMWYVLENYGTDPEITYLVDELELIFVPMINPDGYIENVTNDPNGGGMFRKNKNPNIGTTNPGVDLNRNYSYKWNTTGVSTDEDSDVFPGLSAFSEPETKNMKKITENWGVEFALNAHTYSGLMLYPYGSEVNDIAVEESYFKAIGDHMVTFNNYVNQKSSSLYPASGDSDDYMYHDHGVYAITPEVGTEFWMPAGLITDDCIDMLFSNIVFAHLPLIYGVTKSLDDFSYINTLTGNFNYEITRLGRTAGTLTVSVDPISGIQSVGTGNPYNIAIEETQAGTISYNLIPTIQYGDEVKYVIVTDNGTWQKRDTITKIYGSPTVQFFDEANDLDNWEGDWGLTTVDYYSPDYSFADSPNTNYQNNIDSYFQLNDTIDLSDATDAMVTFRAKWEIENNYDYVQFQVSTDFGNTWIPQCGNYTNLGVSGSGGGQPSEPLYDGVQNEWILEEINLSEYLGEKIMVQFTLITDLYENGDGFYFDDFELMYNIDSSLNINQGDLISFNLFPNPANASFRIAGQEILNGDVLIYNANGQVVKTQKIVGTSKQTEVNIAELDQGIYFVRVMNSDVVSQPKRLVIVR